MKKIIDIHDVFLNRSNKLVLGGTNNLLNDLSLEEIKKMIGKNVVLKRGNSVDMLLHVLDVDMSNSILDQKNIFILIDEKLTPSDISDGSQLYYKD